MTTTTEAPVTGTPAEPATCTRNVLFAPTGVEDRVSRTRCGRSGLKVSACTAAATGATGADRSAWAACAAGAAGAAWAAWAETIGALNPLSSNPLTNATKAHCLAACGTRPTTATRFQPDRPSPHPPNDRGRQTTLAPGHVAGGHA